MPFPGARHLLHALHEAGLVVVLATSASARDVKTVRELLDADDAIDEVVNADDVKRSKPDPEIFDVARDKGRIDPALVLAVGDSVWDVRAAVGPQAWAASRWRVAGSDATSSPRPARSRSTATLRSSEPN